MPPPSPTPRLAYRRTLSRDAGVDGVDAPRGHVAEVERPGPQLAHALHVIPQQLLRHAQQLADARLAALVAPLLDLWRGRGGEGVRGEGKGGKGGKGEKVRRKRDCRGTRTMTALLRSVVSEALSRFPLT